LAVSSIVVSGIAVKAHAQDSAELTSKIQAIEPLMQQLRENRDDLQLLSQVQQRLAEILSIDPANQQALNGMLNLSLWTNKPEEAREWAHKIVTAYPEEKTASYSLAVTDWAVSFPAIMTARNAAGLRPDSFPFLPDASTRATLRNQYGPMIDEGIRSLGSVIKADTNASDAMAYMNLLYRLKAFISENAADAAADLQQAKEWMKKSLAAKPNEHRNTSPWAPPLPPPPPPPPPKQ
jgi:hypothetical protein